MTSPVLIQPGYGNSGPQHWQSLWDVYRQAAMAAVTMAALTACDATRGIGAEATSGAPPLADAATQSAIVSELPLRRGYYVASDTPCEEASNATLLLFRGDGIAGARDFCEFRHVEQLGSGVFHTIQACTHMGEDAPAEEGVTYTLHDDASYDLASDSGWTASFRFCEQATLPEFWRDIDLRDVLGSP
jgi:hypothetical protein